MKWERKGAGRYYDFIYTHIGQTLLRYNDYDKQVSQGGGVRRWENEGENGNEAGTISIISPPATLRNEILSSPSCLNLFIHLRY